MRYSQEFANILTQTVAKTLYSYHHSKTHKFPLNTEQLEEETRKEYLGQFPAKDGIQYPLLRNYTNSLVSIFLNCIKQVNPEKKQTMPKINKKTEITLSLSAEEALWLKLMCQNAVGPENGDQYHIRRSLFISLPDIPELEILANSERKS